MKKRILFDVCHPAAVHLFRPIYNALSAQNWSCLFAAKDKDGTLALLEAFQLPFIPMTKNKKGIFRKLLVLPLDLWLFYSIIHKFKPVIVASNVSIHAAWITRLCGVIHAAFLYTEFRGVMDRLTLPFVKYKVTPASFLKTLSPHHIRYKGNNELSYLAHTAFTPNASILEHLNLKPGEKYVILRFVSWNAVHDIGLEGIKSIYKRKLVQKLEERYRVFISSESQVDPEFRDRLIDIHPCDIHHVLYFADAYIGEGATMASEAACLGTPAVYINPLFPGYCQEEEKAGLLIHYDHVTEKDIEPICLVGKTSEYTRRHKSFIANKIDVSAFFNNFIESVCRVQE